MGMNKDINNLVVVFSLVFSLQFVIAIFYKKLTNKGQMKLAHNLHFIRRLQHILTGMIILYIYQLFNLKEIQFYLAMATTILKILLIIKSNNETARNVVNRALKSIQRPHEQQQYPGGFYFMLGLTIISFSDRLILELGTVLVTIGDPVASIFGISYKHHPMNISYIKGKSMFGTVSGAIAVYLVTILFMYFEFGQFGLLAQIDQFQLFVAVLAINTASELFPSDRKYYCDDNMTIPIVGAVLYKFYFTQIGFQY